MPRTGRPRTPTALHALRGNPGGRPLPIHEPKPPPYTGPCPAWLDEIGREFWDTYAPVLSAHDMLSVLDVPTFSAACERWSLYRRASAALATDLTHGSVANGTVAKPEAALAKAALDGARSILAEFGFTPAARARLGTGTASAGDALDAFTRQRRRG